MPLEKTLALMAEVGRALGLAEFAAGPDGAYQVSIGDATDVFIYGQDDETVLVVSPIAPLPEEPERPLMNYLLRGNLYDADTMPFVVATDEDGWLVFWGRVAIANVTGETLATLIDLVAARVDALRAEIGEAAEEPVE